ncbi:phage tail-collar fiber domain-containing protein [Photobacterium atrarenae]|uniref:Phage tail protein n=1 Tax=Photobacterium atrarenae TaxID=865757 RepID=A0ABY5GQ45_9GAMM|nr:phage tail protein [Photobacterium atrarenae]UTV30866.1 phage tail protein [Photobacterium atrarenae]
MSELVPESEQQYGSILTLAGEAAEQNSKLLKMGVEITHIAFGDANDAYAQPNRNQTSLINEIDRIPVNAVDVQQATPDAVPMLRVEAILPPEKYDLVIREFASVATFNGQELYHAVGNCARIYVPPPANNGNMPTPVTLEMFYVITSGEAIVEIDPRVVHASRDYVAQAINKTELQISQLKIWPSKFDDYLKVGDKVPLSTNAVRLKLSDGSIQVFRVWDKAFFDETHVVSNIQEYGREQFEIQTEHGDFEAISLRLYDLRLSGDLTGWGADPTGKKDATLSVISAADSGLTINHTVSFYCQAQVIFICLWIVTSKDLNLTLMDGVVSLSLTEVRKLQSICLVVKLWLLLKIVIYMQELLRSMD